MPASGPVYQPTTVSYENQNQWASPAGFLAQNGTVGRARCLRWLALGLGLLGIAVGLVMIIEGSVDFSDTRQHEKDDHETRVEEESNEKDVAVIIIGALFLCIGLALVTFYLMVSLRRRGCVCLMSKEQRMARALRSPHGANGQGMNPSTDLLVAAQYAPVSEIAYHPPVVSEEEETRKLMGSDNKDCILKESDSVITLNENRFEPEESPAPRRLQSIHPQPEKQQPDRKPVVRSSSWRAVIQRKASTRSRRAPLAAADELTPSLASSYSSVYFNDYNGEDDDSVESQKSSSI